MAESGAWIDYQHKTTGWKIQKRTELGQSFRAYATWKDRLIQSRQRVELPSSAQSTVDAAWTDKSVFEWEFSCAPSRGIEIGRSVCSTQVQLEQGQPNLFRYDLQNASDATITTLSWPVLGDLVPPDNTDFLYRENFDYGTMKRTPLWPHTGERTRILRYELSDADRG